MNRNKPNEKKDKRNTAPKLNWNFFLDKMAVSLSSIPINFHFGISRLHSNATNASKRPFGKLSVKESLEKFPLFGYIEKVYPKFKTLKIHAFNAQISNGDQNLQWAE